MDNNNRRIAAFGRPAGLVGMALGLLLWSNQQYRPAHTFKTPLQPWSNIDNMINDVRSSLLAHGNNRPNVLILGALGRCGGGAVWVCEQVGLIPTKWDIAETSGGGPFPQIAEEYDILCNSIYLSPDKQIPPFLTKDILLAAESQNKRKLTVVVDVSCDTSNPNNPLPFYHQTTTLAQPVLSIDLHRDGSPVNNKPFEVVAIDHLPSLIPNEASRDFSAALTPHLEALATLYADKPHPSAYIWHKAEHIFNQKLARLLQ